VNVETEEALRQKRDFALEFRIVLPDGTVKYIESIGHPFAICLRVETSASGGWPTWPVP
jgi:hypothetical protein